jgi:predicted DNA-binding transcriptional regulator AlpA
MSDKDEVFWVRMNNSSRAWPDEEIDEYVADHWGARLS